MWHVIDIPFASAEFLQSTKITLALGLGETKTKVPEACMSLFL